MRDVTGEASHHCLLIPLLSSPVFVCIAVHSTTKSLIMKSSFLLLTVLCVAGLDAGSHTPCSSSWQCPGSSRCTGDSSRIGYCTPLRLHDYCTRDSECTSVDDWSECRSAQCQCWSWKQEINSGCWTKSNRSSIATIVLVYTLLPAAVFVTFLILAVRYARRRQMMTRIVAQNVRSVQPQPMQMPPPPQPMAYNPNYAPHMMPPPPTYSQSQGVPRY